MSFKFVTNRHVPTDGDITLVTEPIRYRMTREESETASSQWCVACDVLQDHTPELYAWINFLVKYSRAIESENET